MDNVHVKIVKMLNKLSKNLVIIRKLSKSLPLDTLHILYNTRIDPYLKYCNITLAAVKTSFIDKLFAIKKKIYSNNYW